MAHSCRHKPSCAAEHCSERTPTKQTRLQGCWNVAWRVDVWCVLLMLQRKSRGPDQHGFDVLVSTDVITTAL
jgi:hypothetical protein